MLATSPQLTELLFEFGCGPLVVGVPQYTEIPSLRHDLPEIGSPFMPSLERIVRLKPHRVFVDRSVTPHHLSKGLSAAGIEHKSFDLHSLSDLAVLLSNLHLYCPLASQSEVKRNRIIACLKEILKPRTIQFRFIVFVWFSPAVLAGRETFLSQLISGIGGENALPSLNSKYPQLSREWIMSSKVDIVYILLQEQGDKAAAINEVSRLWERDRPRFQFLVGSHFSKLGLRVLREINRFDPLGGEAVPTSCQNL